MHTAISLLGDKADDRNAMVAAVEDAVPTKDRGVIWPKVKTYQVHVSGD